MSDDGESSLQQRERKSDCDAELDEEGYEIGEHECRGLNSREEADQSNTRLSHCLVGVDLQRFESTQQPSAGQRKKGNSMGN